MSGESSPVLSSPLVRPGSFSPPFLLHLLSALLRMSNQVRFDTPVTARAAKDSEHGKLEGLEDEEAMRRCIHREIGKNYKKFLKLFERSDFLYIIGVSHASFSSRKILQLTDSSWGLQADSSGPIPVLILGKKLHSIFGEEVFLPLCRAKIFADMGVIWSVEKLTDEYMSIWRRAGFSC